MTLATRCTACGTVFRVVEDQLRVSAGWVRCGRCRAVFNAVEHLVDVGPDAPVGPATPGALSVYRDSVLGTLEQVAGYRAPDPAGEPAPAASAAEPVSAASAASGASGAPERVGPVEAHREDTGWPVEPVEDAESRATATAPGAPAVAAPPPPPAWQAGSAAIIRARFPADDTPARDAALPRTPPAPSRADLDAPSGVQLDADDAEAASVSGEDRAEPAPLPEFVRRADRAARWRRPGVRAALGVFALAAAVLLAAQGAWMHHDLIAARWPATAPALARLCATAGCTIEPLRRIEALAVVGSSLVRDAAPGSYRLTVTLGNRDRIALRLPAFDLMLSDAQGRPLVRRVLQPEELGAAGDRIAAGAELALEALLRAGDEPVVGYAVEIFYP